jgi:hypothetical protein
VAEIEGLALADEAAHHLAAGRGKKIIPRKNFGVFGHEESSDIGSRNQQWLPWDLPRDISKE